MTLVYFLIVIALLFVLVIVLFREILGRIESNHRFDLEMWKNFEEWSAGVTKTFYNSRKRDENILRRITKQANYLLQTQALILTTGGKIDGVAKQCRSIDCVVRQCVNNDLEMRSGITKNNKSLKECERILDLFEAVTNKVKNGGLK